jgi:putative ABC transport system ATP-binding protein
VAVARALVNRPEIIFADEPTGNLDRRSSYEVMEIFQRLNQQGHTLVLVTHDQEIAQHGQRIIELIYGNISSEYEVAEPIKAGDLLAGLPKNNETTVLRQ